MAQEYRTSAQDVEKAINRYKQQLDSAGSVNREFLNSKILSLRIMKDNALHTACVLENKAKKIQAAENK